MKFIAGILMVCVVVNCVAFLVVNERQRLTLDRISRLESETAALRLQNERHDKYIEQLMFSRLQMVKMWSDMIGNVKEEQKENECRPSP